MSWWRPRNRRRPPQARARTLPAVPWRRVLTWTGGLAAAVAGAVALGWMLNRPVRTVSIAGRFERVAPVDVERAVRQAVHGAGLIGVDLDGVRAAVRRIPWVDSVSVQRSFPRGLDVTVGEQAAAARWNGGGLLNTRGELFATAAAHIPAELPELSGPEGSEAAMVGRYLAMHERLLEAGMRLTALRLDPRGAWEFDLDNGVTVRLGRKQIDGRFDTFMATAAKIVAQRAVDIAYVDMRYANGFAIGWRGGARAGGTADEARNV